MTSADIGPGPDVGTLRRAYGDLLSLYDGQRHMRVGRQNAERLFLLHGLIAHAVAQGRAAFVLLGDPRLASCAEVNARVAFEHALTAQYVHLRRPSGLDEFEQLIRYREFRFQKAVKRLPNFALPDDVEEVRWVEKPTMNNFFWLCEQFDESGWLYLPYRVLCNSTHPSNSTLASYLHQGDGDLPELRMEARVDDTRAILWAITFSTLMAVGVLEDLRRSKPNKARVQRIASSIQVPALLTLRASAQA